jgi:hypothetical protein
VNKKRKTKERYISQIISFLVIFKKKNKKQIHFSLQTEAKFCEAAGKNGVGR